MPYTDDDGQKVEKGETRVVSRTFNAATDGNGELVVAIPELVDAQEVLGVRLTDDGTGTVDPSAQFSSNATVDGTADGSELTESLEDNEIGINADSDLAGTALANTTIQGTVYVEGE